MTMSSGQSFRGGQGFASLSIAGRFSRSIVDSGGSVSSRRRFTGCSSAAGAAVAVVLAGSWSVGDDMLCGLLW